MNRQIGSVTLPFKQRGIASLIVVLLVGLEVLALSAATLYNVHGTQERQIAAHAQVNSQVAAWTAVENTRLYLSSLDQAGIDALAAGALATGNANVAIEITNVTNAPTPNTKRVTALVTATATAGEAASRVQVVYDVSAGAAPSNTTLTGSMLKGDTTITGGMEFTGENGEGLDFTVDGTLTVTGAGIGGPGLRVLTVTDDTTIDGGVRADIVNTNGTLKLTTGAGVRIIHARGDVIGDNSSMPGIEYIQSDGDVRLGTSSYIQKIDALGSISITHDAYATHGTLTAGRNISLGHGTARLIRAKGNITKDNGGYTAAQAGPNAPTAPIMQALGTIDCSAVSYNHNFLKIQTPGTFIPGNQCQGPLDTSIPSISLPAPQNPYPVGTPVVNVWALKNEANYIFDIDASTGAMQVTVKNITNIDDGVYRLFNGPDAGGVLSNAYICKNNDNTNCAITTGNLNARNKFYINNSLGQYQSIRYDTSNREWILKGGNIAPGVALFVGNLNIMQGTYFNTLLASGNIKTTATANVISPNYAGHAGLCTFTGQSKNLLGVFTSNNGNHTQLAIPAEISPTYYADTLPKNLCDTSSTPTTTTINVNGTNTQFTLLKPNTIGNIALMAGGTAPNDTSYKGGDIHLNNSSNIYGNVLAGEELQITGGANILGRFIAADLRDGHSANNTFNGGVRVNISFQNPDFNETTIPNMGQPAVAPTATMVWSQYP